ncbi:Ni/Fe-hydrogenase, b-type cytochrome subunit [Corynebacterium kozikiae]|uniref:Ni/Fe-hydrogenase, b-type cytochrome subunit n=1 Tax=Corynebacterium kozikiae TaxID=2968469 RepID=UPI00211BB233|nr:Ni/Fe-hydrogenase, b-type cytochrome subunit [Corynebacterium sp. 76QC2CO]MCQ9343975.1 Ni/Fe-hydrogenase, b-type cytochrome subunit [Corynebacterium sp. 76QC2CO]
MTANTHQPELSVISSFPVDIYGQETLIRLAAIVPETSNSPVDLALRRTTDRTYEAGAFSPGTPERPYSIVEARQVYVRSARRDLKVMRGDVDAVMEASHANREQRILARKHFAAMQKAGRKCMAVAIADINSDTPDDFQLAGIVSFGVCSHRFRLAPTRPGYTRVQLWPLALRFQHWFNVAFIVLLSITGYYIMDPFFGPGATQDTGYFMGIVRFVHIASGVGWIALALWRVSLFIFAKEPHMRWRALWPIYNKQDLKNLLGTAKFYMFLSKEAPQYVGHNGLQQLTYTGIYAMCGVQMFTGLSLYALADQTNWFYVVLAYPIHWFGVPAVRLFHAAVMFIIWAFVVVHVYLAFRADSLEDHGGVSSMVNGAVWLPTGSRPVDAPEIE